YTISIDHYVEFWNISNHDILLADLGPSPFLLIANQPGWDAGGLTDIPAGASRDITIPLSSLTRVSDHQAFTGFPAGTVTVITTDPTLLNTLTPNAANVYQAAIPNNLRTYSGQTQKKSNSE